MKQAILACIFATALFGSGAAAASEQCLSEAELGSVGRMASVMAMGVAVQRCGRCLGPERYAEVLKTYDAAGLMADFSKAEKTLDADQDQRDAVDQLMRDSARAFAETLSANCSACEKTADMLDALTSDGARGDFYQSETKAVANASKARVCR
jgi:hypothetical protein